MRVQWGCAAELPDGGAHGAASCTDAHPTRSASAIEEAVPIQKQNLTGARAAWAGQPQNRIQNCTMLQPGLCAR